MILKFGQWLLILSIIVLSSSIAFSKNDQLLAVSKTLRMSLQSSVADRYIFSGNGHRVIFCPELRFAIVDGTRLPLAETVRYIDGMIFFPSPVLQSVKTYLQKKNEAPASAVREPKDQTHPSKRFLTVMIDPGHGGHLPGAVNPRMGLQEKDINLQIGLELRTLLQAQGVKVIMTRDTDKAMGKKVPQDVAARSRVANKKLPDFFISIHANSAGPSARGFEVFYDSQQWSLSDKAAVASRRTDLDVKRHGGEKAVDSKTEAILYRMIFDDNLRLSKAMAETMIRHLKKDIDDTNRGVKTKNLHVTRETFVPSVLVETGFLTHPKTARRFKTASYRHKISQSLADAVMEFMRTYGTRRSSSK